MILNSVGFDFSEKLQYLYPFSTEGTQGLEQELADSLYCPACLPDCELTQHFVRSNKIPFHQKKRGFQNDFVLVKLSISFNGTYSIDICLPTLAEYAPKSKQNS